jgi:chromosome segregation ATPase
MSDQPTNPAGDNERLLRAIDDLRRDTRAQFDEVKQRLTSVESRLEVLENKIPATNPLPAVMAMLEEQKELITQFKKETHTALRDIGKELHKQGMEWADLDERVEKLEDDQKPKH